MNPPAPRTCLMAVAVAACLGITGTAHAKLASTRGQESRMIRLAVAAAEKWRSGAGRDFRPNDSLRPALSQTRGQIGGYEGGILADMGIAADMASMLVCARSTGARGIRVISVFDTAARQLSMDDQQRYFLAKARIGSELVRSSVPRDSLVSAIEAVVGDYALAVANGCDPRKAAAGVRKLLDDAGLKDLFLDEYTCRMHQAWASYAVARVRQLHAAHREKDAVDLARRVLKELSPDMSLKAGDCKLSGAADLAKAYDAAFIAPVARLLGRDGDAFLIAACDRYWDNKALVAIVLPRVRSATKQSLEMFKRAGQDDVLKTDKAIALAEVTAWKKAGRGKEFRTLYPERYKLALWVNQKGK